ncbi:MAG: hypothetical protein J6Y62_01725 [Clostridia bacterium]|nr:hypothetical protein [Clostridia bacterium]
MKGKDEDRRWWEKDKDGIPVLPLKIAEDLMEDVDRRTWTDSSSFCLVDRHVGFSIRRRTSFKTEAIMGFFFDKEKPLDWQKMKFQSPRLEYKVPWWPGEEPPEPVALTPRLLKTSVEAYLRLLIATDGPMREMGLERVSWPTDYIFRTPKTSFLLFWNSSISERPLVSVRLIPEGNEIGGMVRSYPGCSSLPEACRMILNDESVLKYTGMTSAELFAAMPEGARRRVVEC